MAFDTLILNGTAVDGTGKPAYKGDLRITDGKRAAIGALSESEAGRKKDTTGHVVSR